MSLRSKTYLERPLECLPIASRTLIRALWGWADGLGRPYPWQMVL